MMKQIPGHPMYWITTCGKIYSEHVDRFIRPTIRTYNGSGYHRVGLLISSSPRKYKYYYVHRLVLLTWKGPCPEGMEVDHRNYDTSDNRLSNLRYVTPKENCSTRRKHGYTPNPNLIRENL
jgi:hypothetical protein